MRRHGPSRAGMVQGRYWLAVLALAGWLCSVPAAAEPSGSAAPVVLTNAQQVLALGLELARPEDVAVRLRGVVTHLPVLRERWFYLQDETAGLLVVADEEPFRFVPGQLVEVEGVAMAGLFAVHVRGRQVRLLGTAPWPEPRRTPPAELAAGADFGRWVVLSATVRDVAFFKDRLVLLCAAEGQRFQVWTTFRERAPLPVDLLDARLELRGVAWTEVDAGRRPIGFQLHQPGTNCFTVLKAGSASIFSGTTCTIATLRQRDGASDDRVKVAGIVTLHSPAGWLALQDDSGAVWARQLKPLVPMDEARSFFPERRAPPLRPGDRIELVGAPAGPRSFAPALEDAEYRYLGAGPAPSPRSVSSAELTSGRYDAELVRLKARVVDVESHRDQELFEEKLWVQSGGFTFEAVLETRERIPLAVRKDDFVAVTAVCHVEPGQLQQVRSIRLHLRGPADLAVTRPPSWWTLRWAAWLLAGGGALVLAGLIAIAFLRRQVARRTAELSDANARLCVQVAGRQRAETDLRAALAAEKELNQLKSSFVSMVSHEFRTPLGAIQSSAELLQQYFDRLTPERRARLLRAIVVSTGDMARIMEDVLLLSQVETARYEFRPRRLSLTELCQRLVEETTGATKGRCPIELRLGSLPELSWCDEGLLRHVLNNLLSNAVKYSPEGTPVEFRVEPADREVVFTVRDRGLGIPVEDRGRLFQAFTRGSNVGDTPGTGLGLVIVQRCLTLHGGTINLDSAPGAGTTVTVRLPLLPHTGSDTPPIRRRRERASSPNDRLHP